MMNQRWLEIRFRASAEQADSVAGILLSSGLLSATIDEPDGRAAVCLYLPDEAAGRRECQRARDRVRQLLGGTAECSVRVRDECDWANAWKEQWHPVRVGRIVVAPTWEAFTPGPDDVLIRIDPEMAFGTGTHESTRLCLLALQEQVRHGDDVLDIGAGSGVLSIAAARLGAARSVAVEIDPVAAQAAHRNVERNDCSPAVDVVIASGTEALRGEYDVAVANIDATVVRLLARPLAQRLKPGGYYVAGGFTDRGEEAVRRTLEDHFAIEKALSENGWRCLIARRRA